MTNLTHLVHVFPHWRSDTRVVGGRWHAVKKCQHTALTLRHMATCLLRCTIWRRCLQSNEILYPNMG